MKNGCFVAGRGLVAVGALVVLTAVSQAQQTRVYEKDGVTYREDRHIVRKPVSEVRYEQHPETVQREVISPRIDTAYQTVYSPVTEYRLEAKWVGRWNPFVQPYLVSQWQPRTRWEARVDSIPTVRYERQWLTETRQRQVPVLVRRMEETEVVATTAVPNLSDGNNTSPPSYVARHETIGSLGTLPAQSVMGTSNSLPLLR
jgi:hypothetical protein